MRFSNSKLDRFYDKLASKFRARGGKTQEFFDIERNKLVQDQLIKTLHNKFQEN